jgi:hypothetical protein
VYSETKARPRFFIDRVAPDTAMRRTSAVVQPVAGTYG